MIRFQDVNGSWFEYREQTVHGAKVIENRSNLEYEWRPSMIFATLDDVRLYYSYSNSYYEVPVPSDPTSSTTVVTSNTNITNPIPEPLHKCFCSWDKVYQEGCRCGGI